MNTPATPIVGHTPGPWTVSALTNKGWEIASADVWLADVWTSEADARLLAAAPDLLKELMRLVAGRGLDHFYDNARAEIAKATGAGS